MAEVLSRKTPGILGQLWNCDRVAIEHVLWGEALPLGTVVQRDELVVLAEALKLKKEM